MFVNDENLPYVSISVLLFSFGVFFATVEPYFGSRSVSHPRRSSCASPFPPLTLLASSTLPLFSRFCVPCTRCIAFVVLGSLNLV